MSIKQLGKISKSDAGRLGGLARQAKYGNPGTSEGRRLGGLHSQATHRKNKTGFTLLKNVRKPRRSRKLAEIFGILAGDGHVGLYQVSMTTNARTDRQHALYVQKLLAELFRTDVSITKRKTSNAVVVVLSSRQASDFFVSNGLVQGNKVHAQLGVPTWIQNNTAYSRAFTRGLFDTDGSVYVDLHRINGRVYQNIGLAFTNKSKPLLAFFKCALETLGLHPTQKTESVVFLRREIEVCRYFDLIGSSNQKHIGKFHMYMKRKGRVA